MVEATAIVHGCTNLKAKTQHLREVLELGDAAKAFIKDPELAVSLVFVLWRFGKMEYWQIFEYSPTDGYLRAKLVNSVAHTETRFAVGTLASLICPEISVLTKVNAAVEQAEDLNFPVGGRISTVRFASASGGGLFYHLIDIKTMESAPPQILEIANKPVERYSGGGSSREGELLGATGPGRGVPPAVDHLLTAGEDVLRGRNREVASIYVALEHRGGSFATDYSFAWFVDLPYDQAQNLMSFRVTSLAYFKSGTRDSMYQYAERKLKSEAIVMDGGGRRPGT
jgi:hypothetical protein